MKIRWPWVSRKRLERAVELADKVQDLAEAAVDREMSTNAMLNDERRLSLEMAAKADAAAADAAKFAAKTMMIRGAKIENDELNKLLLIRMDNPVLRGVLEVIARNEDAVTDGYVNEDDAEIRAAGALVLRAIRNLRADLLDAVKMANGPEK